jgi:hypothetical protein
MDGFGELEIIGEVALAMLSLILKLISVIHMLYDFLHPPLVQEQLLVSRRRKPP